MSRWCTSCAHKRDLSFFQRRVAITGENKLLRTCSICRDKSRRYFARKKQSALDESNATNLATPNTLLATTSASSTAVRRPREDDDDTLHPAVRRCREIMASFNLPAPVLPASDHPPPDLSPPELPPPDLPPPDLPTLDLTPPELPPPDLERNRV